jgi:hypothetical protein
MLRRLIETVREFGTGSDFEAYFTQIQRRNASAAPSIQDARKDYKAALHTHTLLPF